jgi:hypothetical protein
MAVLVPLLVAQEPAMVAFEVGLRARGQAFWEARIKEDYAGQYALLEPKVRRQMRLTTSMQAQGPLQYLEARIEGVTIDEAKAVLTVRTRVRIKHPLLERRNQELVVREEWVERQGEWYRVYPPRARRAPPAGRPGAREAMCSTPGWSVQGGVGEEASCTEAPRHRKEVSGAWRDER